LKSAILPDFCFSTSARLTLKTGAFLPNAHLNIAAKLNIRAATSHIRRNRYCTGHTRLRHNIGFLLMETRIQNQQTFLTGLPERAASYSFDRPFRISEVDHRIAFRN
jgi:hypothetical protein